MKTISVIKDFSRFPGPRYICEGKFSGEEFRTNVLRNAVKEAIDCSDKLIIDLDGTAGFGTSFLEESFGGLIREDKISFKDLNKTLVYKSDEEPEWIDEIKLYIEEAHKKP